MHKTLTKMFNLTFKILAELSLVLKFIKYIYLVLLNYKEISWCLIKILCNNDVSRLLQRV